MAIKHLNPYINLNGTAAQAIELYERTLGAKVENLMRWGDVPGMDVKPEAKGRIMHAALRLGEGMLMISDAPVAVQVPSDSNISVCLDLSDIQDMATKFDALAASGQVTYPIHDTFYGGKLGMLTDAFGVRWMFNYIVQKG